jgi:hypothetical protein
MEAKGLLQLIFLKLFLVCLHINLLPFYFTGLLNSVSHNIAANARVRANDDLYYIYLFLFTAHVFTELSLSHTA